MLGSLLTFLQVTFRTASVRLRKLAPFRVCVNPHHPHDGLRLGYLLAIKTGDIRIDHSVTRTANCFVKVGMSAGLKKLSEAILIFDTIETSISFGLSIRSQLCAD